MSTIRVVSGTASAPTRMASYDAALAEANVHNYNLVGVSSVIPADATVERVDAAPDLGPVGNRLTVVEARHTAAGPGQVTAGLAWARSEEGPGIFYEAAGGEDEEHLRERLASGLAAGKGLRDWTFAGDEFEIAGADADSGTYTTALVLAIYGESEPIC